MTFPSNSGMDVQTSFFDKACVPIAGLLCIFLLYLRSEYSFTSPQFWAEDGTIFWSQQATFGLKALFSPYAGYYHLTPRLVAAVSSLFDQAHAPTLFFAGYVAFTFWSAATAASCVSSPRLGIMLGVGLMLPPIGFGEVLGTITNVQWIMAPTLALLLLPARISVNRLAYACVASLTGPFSIFLAPIAAYQFLRSRDAVSGVILIGAIIQGTTLFFDGVIPIDKGEGSVLHLLGVLAFRPFLYDAVATVLGIAIIFASLQSSARSFRMILIYLAVAVIASTLARFQISPKLLDSEFGGSRYFYIPRVVLIWCAMSIAFIDWKNTALAVAFIISLEFAGLEHLKKAPLADAEWARHYRAGAAKINISPLGWDVTIPNR